MSNLKEDLTVFDIDFPRDANGHPMSIVGAINPDPNGDFTEQPKNITYTEFPAVKKRALDVNVTGATFEMPPEVEIKNDTGNPVPVTIVEGGGISESIVAYGYQDSIPANALTTIVTYAPATNMYLDGFVAVTDVDARFALYINSALKLVYRTSEQDRTAKMLLTVPIKIAAGTILDIKGIHVYPVAVKLEATLLGHR